MSISVSANGLAHPAGAPDPKRHWLHEALWCLLIAPLILAPLVFGAPRLLLLAGSGLAFWRAFMIGKRLLRGRQHQIDIGLDRHNSWALLVALALVMAPHALRLPWWLTALILLFIGWRIAVMHGRLRAPPRSLLILMVSAASGGVFLQYGTLFGREAGVALLSIMISLKLLELKAQRDAVVLVFLAYFLVITNFLFSQTLPTAALMLAAVWVITATMIGLQHRQPPLRHAGVLAAQMLMQAVPLMVALFLFFPRVPGPLWGVPRDATRATTGLSDSMSPGSFGQLSASGDIAFRVEFAGPPPRTAQLYWRGPVFWQFDGRIWTTGVAPPGTGVPSVRAISEPIAYTVTVEPSSERWLLALDMPTASPPDARLSTDYVLLANAPLRSRLRYEGRSALDFRAGENETEATLRRGLQLPDSLNPRARALAATLRAAASDDRDIVQAVLSRFRNEPFFYTTSPPPLASDDTVDQFLFESRRGFCEHYASSFTFLMRAAGVPARVVTGYQGGVLNPVGNYLVVRQAEAHAWVEVWLPGEGWVRVDPTAAVSPSRVESGIAASIVDSDPLPFLVRGSVPLLSRAGFTLDAITNAWNQRVLAYNVQRQQQLLRDLGLEASDWRMLSVLLLASAALATLLAVVLALRGLRGERRDPVVIAWARTCRKLARAGLVRSPAEGPSAFARRVGVARPDLAPAVQTIAATYVQLRYARPDSGSVKTRTSEFRRQIRALKT